MNERDRDLDGEEFARVRDLLANAPLIEPRPGALDRIVAEVASEPDPVRPVVVDLASRRPTRYQRWLPRVAAAAVVIAIVGAVVGGVGGNTRLPAVGDLVDSHQAAAAETMPETADEMPMETAHAMGPAMPESMKMTAAYVETGDTIHLVYRDSAGGVVSVFRQDGDTDLADIGGEGDIEMMGDTPVWTAIVADMHVAVLDGDGYVWTVVADHHDKAMMAVMTDDLPSRSPSLLDRLVDLADVVAEPWRFGG